MHSISQRKADKLFVQSSYQLLTRYNLLLLNDGIMSYQTQLGSINDRT